MANLKKWQFFKKNIMFSIVENVTCFTYGTSFTFFQIRKIDNEVEIPVVNVNDKSID